MNTIVEVSASEATLLAKQETQRQAGNLLRTETLAGDTNEQVSRISTGMTELDRVLGGGLAQGGVVLIGGEPGIGKSTLLAQACQGTAQSTSVCYISAEESTAQVRDRCHRLGVEHPAIALAHHNDASTIAGAIRSGDYGLIIVDSIQLLADTNNDGVPGSVSQIKACAAILVEAAKASGATLMIVGHVTKDGTLAGPRLLEHLVDTVLNFEGDRYHELRTLRAVKNRFGNTNEIGLFTMTATGLAEVQDPGGLFIAGRDATCPGTCVVPLIEGNRALLVEVQALVNTGDLPQPQRRVAGCDHNRVAMIVAVLSRRLRLPLGGCDIFVNVTGGARINEPSADLAIALAIASAFRDKAVPEDLVALGEVGLGGELRPASRYDMRASEARRLGFKRLLGPGPGSGRGRLKAEHLRQAISQAIGGSDDD